MSYRYHLTPLSLFIFITDPFITFIFFISILKNLTPDDVKEQMLAGEPILSILTKAPGNGASIGGLKVVTENGWFALRPSGTEPIYKIYAESFISKVHLDLILSEAQMMVSKLF